MKVKVTVHVDLKDKNGKTVKTLSRVCHSYIRQLIDALFIGMAQSSTTTKDTGGTSRTQTLQTTLLRLNAASGNDGYGIQVGSGTEAVTISSYQLKTQILHGDTSGKLNHGAVSVGTVAIVGSTAKFTIARTFTNNSGADIDVHEVGLVTNNSYAFMIEKTLLDFTVANGVSGTVTYTVSVSV